jgi:hypothetical protein
MNDESRTGKHKTGRFDDEMFALDKYGNETGCHNKDHDTCDDCHRETGS